MKHYRCIFTAVKPNKRGQIISIKREFQVKARDTYHAMDKIKDQLPDYGSLRLKCFRFNEPKKLAPDYLDDAINNLGREHA
jgi:hypothetical protein